MEIVRIFGNRLFAFKYKNESKDEFERLFDLWHDIEYLENFFEQNKYVLTRIPWEKISVEKAILRTLSDVGAGTY